jgi:hypothetical protein
MTNEVSSQTAWLVLAFGDDRQYAGNTGYDDELTETYRYDSNVANWKRVAAGNLLLLRDREQLIGVARVRRIESYPSTKSLQRCPVCRTTGIKERRHREPRFRCNNGHEFELPAMDIVRCTKLEARFESSFRRASGMVSTERLRSACPRYTDQLSVQRLDLSGLSEDLQRAVPGYEALFVDGAPAEPTRESGEPGGVPETLPAEGGIGVPYRRPNEEFLSADRDPFEVDPAAVERANREHARTQNLLADTLEAIGLVPRSPASTEPEYDLGWEVGECVFVGEVKSLTPNNEERQLRLALGQVLRYRHMLARGGRRVIGVLMLERQPVERTWIGLCHELGVVLLWPEVLQGLPAVLFRGQPTAPS